jgi:hypothetical protein
MLRTIDERAEARNERFQFPRRRLLPDRRDRLRQEEQLNDLFNRGDSEDGPQGI